MSSWQGCGGGIEGHVAPTVSPVGLVAVGDVWQGGVLLAGGIPRCPGCPTAGWWLRGTGGTCVVPQASCWWHKGTGGIVVPPRQDGDEGHRGHPGCPHGGALAVGDTWAPRGVPTAGSWWWGTQRTPGLSPPWGSGSGGHKGHPGCPHHGALAVGDTWAPRVSRHRGHGGGGRVPPGAPWQCPHRPRPRRRAAAATRRSGAWTAGARGPAAAAPSPSSRSAGRGGARRGSPAVPSLSPHPPSVPRASC